MDSPDIPYNLDTRSVTATSTSDSPRSDSGKSSHTAQTTYSDTHSDVPFLQDNQASAPSQNGELPPLGILAAQAATSVSRFTSHRMEGWPSVANIMAKKPDITSFSRFQELNIQNLLYYQAEIDFLQYQLRQLETLDTDAGMVFTKNLSRLIKAGDDPTHPRGRKQWEVVCKIRKRLKQYNEALVLYKQLTELPKPDHHNVETLRVWLRMPGYGNCKLVGAGSKTWGNLGKEPEEEGHILKRILLLPWRLFFPQKDATNNLDLVAMPSSYQQDGFVRWIRDDCVPILHSIRKSFKRKDPRPTDEEGQSPAEQETEKQRRKEEKKRQEEEKKRQQEEEKNGMDSYSEKWMQWIASSVATVVACVLPTVAIGILTTAQGTMHKLLYIGGFTMLFAMGLMLLTDCGTSRLQIFTATAAFSAVLVVFVQNNGQ